MTRSRRRREIAARDTSCEARRTACRRHALRRAWQRLGLALARPDLRAIERRVADGEAALVRRHDDGRAVYRARWRNRPVYVVYDHDLGCAVTFLPKGWAERPT
ncbi:MAG: hypothetical protein ACE5GS_05835 [Kiloniellaceae bacterium]